MNTNTTRTIKTTPSRSKKPGKKLAIEICTRHINFRGDACIFIKLSRAPDKDVASELAILELFRWHSCYRKGPHGTSGWHLPLDKVETFCSAMQDHWAKLSETVRQAAAVSKATAPVAARSQAEWDSFKYKGRRKPNVVLLR